MVERKQIYGNISVFPDELVSNMDDLLEYKIKEKYEKSCDKDYGFILKIENIKDNYTNIINSLGNGEILYKICFICLVLKPIKGLTLTGKISMIFRHGIFANVDKIKVLIPVSKLNNWEFKNDAFEKDQKILKVDDIIQIVISDVRYEKKIFSCIGSLYES